MIGFPKHLNTRADVDLIINEFPRSKWWPRLQELLDGRMIWWNCGELAQGEAGTVDETHKVVEQDMTGASTRYQYGWKEDPNCELFRLGLTVAEVEKMLA